MQGFICGCQNDVRLVGLCGVTIGLLGPGFDALTHSCTCRRRHHAPRPWHQAFVHHAPRRCVWIGESCPSLCIYDSRQFLSSFDAWSNVHGLLFTAAITISRSFLSSFGAFASLRPSHVTAFKMDARVRVYARMRLSYVDLVAMMVAMTTETVVEAVAPLSTSDAHRSF